MKTFKQKNVIQDARSKIRPKFTDARTKLLNNAKSKTFQNDIKKSIDARQNIKVLGAKNVKQNRLKPPPVVVKKEKKVQRVVPINKPGPSTSFTTRTIKNPVAIKKQEKEVIDVENYTFKNKTDWDGFVSVSNGNRVLTERVTMDGVGMKIAVRNDCVKKTAKNVNKKALISGKKKITMNSETPLRITTENPAAIAKIKKKKAQLTNQKNRASNLLKASQFKLLKKRKENMQLPPPNPISQIPYVTPTPPPATKTIRYSPPPQPIPTITGYTQNQTLMSDFPLGRQKNLVVKGIRPMISSESNDFRQLIHSVSHQTVPAVQTQGSDASITSPLEGTKIYVSNLHPVVVEDDILELFSVLGPLRRARMVGHGTAEVVFIRQNDAVKAYHKYNNRDLDGQPMHMKLLLQDRKPHNIKYSWMNEIGTRSSQNSETREIEPAILQRALFKGGSTGSSARPVVFTVKI